MPVEDTRTTTELFIKEIGKVMREEDPSGRLHNTKVLILPHPPLNNVNEWRLLLHLDSEHIETLSLMVDGWEPTTQTEFIFEGNLIDSDSIFLQALRNKEVVATAFLSIRIRDLHSNVAWVGNYKTSPVSSLRLVASEEVGVVPGYEKNCTAAESPCYSIRPKANSTIIKRCIHFYYGSTRTVGLCDERETDFLELLPTPSLFLQEDGKLRVSLRFNQNAPVVEIVAFDSEDHTTLYSNSSYKCQQQDDRILKNGETFSCLHKLTLPEGQDKMTVLVVRMDEDGYVYDSSQVVFEGNPTKHSRTGVIVGSVVGSLVGIGVIVTLVFLFALRKRTKKKKTLDNKQELSAAYSRAPTSSAET